MSRRNHSNEPVPPAWFRCRPEYRSAQQQAAAKTEARRVEALEALERLREEEEAALQPLTAAESEAWASLKEAKAAVADKQAEYRAACTKKRDAAENFRHRREQLDRDVRRNVPTCIVETIHKLHELERETMAVKIKTEDHAELSPQIGRPRSVRYSNSKSIAKRLTAIRENIAAAEALKTKRVLHLESTLALLLNVPSVDGWMHKCTPEPIEIADAEPRTVTKKRTLLDKLFGD